MALFTDHMIRNELSELLQSLPVVYEISEIF